MPDPLFSVFMALMGIYVLVVLVLAVGWQRVVWTSRHVSEADRSESDQGVLDNLPSVTVLIPARNEARSIEACIASVLENHYPADRLEVVVIDDGSTDGTAARARRATMRYNARVQNGSKVALAQGPGGRVQEQSPGEENDSIDVRIVSTQTPSDTEDHGIAGGDPVAATGAVATDRPENGRDFEGLDPPASSSVNAPPNGVSPGGITRHKAAALRRGVAESTGEVILSTDADCTVGDRWIRTMVASCTEETPYVSGPIRYQWKERWFERFQALEMAALVAVGGGSLGAGFATICNGANVATRRSLLEPSTGSSARDVEGGIAADEVLMQHVAYATDQSPVFQAHPDAVVETEGVSSFRAYLQQRIRWAWMGSRYPHVVPRLVSSFAWTLHTAVLGFGIGALFISAWQPVVVGALIAKMAVDGALIAPAARHLGSGDLLRSFVPASLLWIPVVVTVGILGTFGSVEWKGRPIGTSAGSAH